MALATYGHVIEELEGPRSGRQRRPSTRRVRAVFPQSSLSALRRLQDTLAAHAKLPQNA